MHGTEQLTKTDTANKNMLTETDENLDVSCNNYLPSSEPIESFENCNLFNKTNGSLSEQLHNFYPTLTRDPVDSGSINNNMLDSSITSLPKPGARFLSEFPSIQNRNINETIKKEGLFNYEKSLKSSINSNQNQSINTSLDTSNIMGIRYGTVALDNNDVYEGEWNNQKRWGYGKLLSHLGFYYEGFWKNDVANGQGRMINNNGDMYQGDWINGKYHGKGTFVGVNGYRYVGDWSQDMQNGSGCEIWPDGSSFEGEYKWSKKHGKGLFKWINGEKYFGEFSANNLDGEGVYEWPNGQKYIGVWKENKICGEGRLETPRQNKGNIEKKIFASPDCATFKKDLKCRSQNYENLINNENKLTTTNIEDANRKSKQNLHQTSRKENDIAALPQKCVNFNKAFKYETK